MQICMLEKSVIWSFQWTSPVELFAFARFRWIQFTNEWHSLPTVEHFPWSGGISYCNTTQCFTFTAREKSIKPSLFLLNFIPYMVLFTIEKKVPKPEKDDNEWEHRLNRKILLLVLLHEDRQMRGELVYYSVIHSMMLVEMNFYLFHSHVPQLMKIDSWFAPNSLHWLNGHDDFHK